MHRFAAPFQARYLPLTVSVVAVVVLAISLAIWPQWAAPLGVALALAGFLAVLGLRDVTQTRHAILRNYPILAHMRFIFEHLRPAMRQYFFEDDKDGMPFGRDKRAIVYQRAKRELDKRPFGTQYDV